jgi:DNA ligase-1
MIRSWQTDPNDSLLPVGERRVFEDGKYRMSWSGLSLFCECPRFKFQRLPVVNRVLCKHMRERFPDYEGPHRVGAASLEPAPCVQQRADPPALLEYTPLDRSRHQVNGWWWCARPTGSRVLWNGHQLLTRTGAVIKSPWRLPPGVQLDGFLGTEDETDACQLHMHPATSPLWHRATFWVVDTPDWGLQTLRERWSHLHQALQKTRFCRRVQCVSYRRVRSLENLEERAEAALVGGQVVAFSLRLPEGVYTGGRRNQFNLEMRVHHLAQGKVMQRKEKGSSVWWVRVLRAVGATPGTRIALTLPRTSHNPTGCRVHFRFQGITSGGRPRFPRFESLEVT